MAQESILACQTWFVGEALQLLHRARYLHFAVQGSGPRLAQTWWVFSIKICLSDRTEMAKEGYWNLSRMKAMKVRSR